MIWKLAAKFLNEFLPSRVKSHLKPMLGVPSIESSLLNLKRNNYVIDNFLDIGAYKGSFTKLLVSIWPNAKGIMIEANPMLESYLSDYILLNKNISYKMALLTSESQKEVPFYLSDTASSVLRTHTGGEQPIILQSFQLDELLKAYKNFLRIDLLKLDVQGLELEILKGGKNTLMKSAAVLLEVALLDIYANSPLANDVMFFMKENSFVLYDICSADIRRPADNALWQTDFLFVKEDSTLRLNKLYF